MRENKRCIISLATKANRYVDNLARLSNSLRDNFKTGDFLGFIHESSVGAPLHSENPYAFKVYAFNKAIELGYTSVLWLDTSVYAVGNVDSIFDDIENQGLVFQDAGHKLGDWCNDETLSYFGLTRLMADKINMIGNAGFLGLDFTDSDANEFLNKWRLSMERGMFNGSWENHRHDMSCSSAIIEQMGLFDLAYSGDKVLQYGGIFDKVINETIILKAQG